MTATFVSHLECSITGERYEAGRVHGLSAAGRPLLVRYDLSAMGAAVDRDALTTDPGFWRFAPMLPVSDPGNRVSLGEVVTPLIPLGRETLGGRAVVKDEGRLPTGSFKARGLAWPWRWRASWVCGTSRSRRTATPARRWRPMRRGPGCRATVFCPVGHPRHQHSRDRPARRRHLAGRRADQRVRQDRGRGEGGGRLVRRLDPEGALPHRGQEDDGAGAGASRSAGACPT